MKFIEVNDIHQKRTIHINVNHIIYIHRNDEEQNCQIILINGERIITEESFDEINLELKEK